MSDEVGTAAAASAGPSGAVIGVVAGVLVVLVIGLVLVTGGDGDEVVLGPSPSPSPEPTPTETEPPTPEPTPEPTEPEPTPEPTEPEESGDREPTAADAADFAARYQPEGGRDVDSVTVDVTGDGWAEVVFSSIANDAVRIDVAVWDGQAYQIVYAGQGGRADVIERLIVRDFTGDDRREIVTLQTFDDDGEALSIWGFTTDGFAPHRAQGGCWNGSNTYGIVGVSITDGEITATCEGPADVQPAFWPRDVYRWDGQAWAHEETRDPTLPDED